MLQLHICESPPPTHQNQSTCSMHYLKPKMRKQTVIYLLLAWLLLAAPQHHYYSTKLMVQAVRSDEFKVRTAQPSSRSSTGKVFPTWVEWKTFRRAPSGPNPVGNHHPPSKH